MKRLMLIGFVFTAVLATAPQSQAKGDGFADAVKLVEQFYQVKHQSIPFLARAGIKTATTVGRLTGGPRRQLAEAGSVKVAYFEDQDFKANANYLGFRASMNAALADGWSPFIQVASSGTEGQTYIYLRNAGEKFNVLVVTIETREGCVVQVTLSPQTLAKLMKNPDEMGETITVDATTNDQD
jgi:hypothetical protein